MPPGGKYKTRAELFVRTALLVFGALLIFFFAVSAVMAAWRMYGRLQSATSDADTAKRQLTLVSAQDAKAKSDMAELSSPLGVEAALRSRYGVVKPGEGIIQIVDRSSAASDAAATSSTGFLSDLIHTLWPW